MPAHIQLSENIGGGRWFCPVCITDIIQCAAEDICAMDEVGENTTVSGAEHATVAEERRTRKRERRRTRDIIS